MKRYALSALWFILKDEGGNDVDETFFNAA